jgi:cell wall-associated NlpC family hydrolase
MRHERTQETKRLLQMAVPGVAGCRDSDVARARPKHRERIQAPSRMAPDRVPTRRPFPEPEVCMIARAVLRRVGATAVSSLMMLTVTGPAYAHHLDNAHKQRKHIEERARRQVGTRYASGGTSPRGFDCSGLTRWTFLDHGANLPHSSTDQFYMAGRKGHKRIWKRSRLKVGDLVFHKTTSARVGHVGIYIGGGRFISSTSSEGVRVRSLYDPYYWGPRWVGATRLPATMNTRSEYRSERRSEKR